MVGAVVALGMAVAAVETAKDRSAAAANSHRI
jgi:hypothetical protein